jgi:hypothetical protein
VTFYDELGLAPRRNRIEHRVVHCSGDESLDQEVGPGSAFANSNSEAREWIDAIK